MFHRPIAPARPATARHRLFFALVPPLVQARQIANAAAWFDDDGTPVAADRLHVTLFILDDRVDLPPPLIGKLRAVGAAVAAAPIKIVLGRAVGSGRSITLRPSRKIAALDGLLHQLESLCATADLPARADYERRPHMTLGYRDGRPFNTPIAPVIWTARELVLIHSHLGKTRHERLGSWPFDAPEPQPDLFG